MTPQDAQYRFRVAQGFLEESRQDVALNRWRSAVDNAQLAVENAAKAVLALIAPVGRTHNLILSLRLGLGFTSNQSTLRIILPKFRLASMYSCASRA